MSITSDIKILQINMNKSQPATENTLQVATEPGVDLIFIQEPWLIPKNQAGNNYSGLRSVNYPNFIQILPNYDPMYRPRTLIYASNQIKAQAKLASHSPQEADLQILEISSGKEVINIINIYNQVYQASKIRTTAERCLYQLKVPINTIVIGDFNIHPPLWESHASTTVEEETLVTWMEDHQLELINEPCQGTFFRSHMTQSTVLDLTLASGSMAEKIQDWQVIPDLGFRPFGPALYYPRPFYANLPQPYLAKSQI